VKTYRRKKTDLLKVTEEPVQVIQSQDQFLRLKTKMPLSAESADNSPPAIEITRKKVGDVKKDRGWQRKLFKIVLDQVKLLYENYGLPYAPHLKQAAHQVYWAAKIIVEGDPDRYIKPKEIPQDDKSKAAADCEESSVYELHPELVKDLVFILFRSHETMLRDFKDASDSARADLQRELAMKLVNFMRELDGKRFVMGKGIVDAIGPSDLRLVELEDCPFQLIVLDAMREQKRAELANPRNRTLKVTQANVARRLNMNRTTFESKLCNPNNPLKWKSLKAKIDEEFRQKS